MKSWAHADKAANHLEVTDQETGESIPNVVYANDESGLVIQRIIPEGGRKKGVDYIESYRSIKLKPSSLSIKGLG